MENQEAEDEETRLQILEANFQKFLFERCQTKDPYYDPMSVFNLIMTLTPDRIVAGMNQIEEATPFRPITFKLLTMLASNLVFNKNCIPCSLLPRERSMLQ